MASVQPLQSSFAFGEISPRLLGRSDTERYRQSLRICENLFTFSHGNVTKRPGTGYLVKSPTEGNIKLFDLQGSPETPLVVELGWRSGGGYLRVLDRSGYVIGGTNFVLNPQFLEGLNSWTDGSDENASIVWTAPAFAQFLPSTQGGGRTARLQQQVTVTTPTVLHRLYVVLLATGVGNVATVNVGTTPGASDLFTGGAGSGENFFAFTPGAGVSTFWVSIEVEGAQASETTLCDVVALVEDSATVYEAATPWSNDDLRRMTAATSTKQVALYFATESQPPHRFIVNAPGVFTFEPVPFTTQPTAWAPGNYPHAVTFYQRRLWYAATPLQQDTLWGSKIGDFLDFGVGTGQPTDAIEFEMSDRGVIEWIQGARDLLIGADVAEYVLTSEGGVIIPGDIEVQQQSAYGSAHQEPVEVGNGVLYLGNDRRRIRFMNYQFLEEGWVSVDLTWPSEHVTKGLVREMHFRYAPDPFIWCVLEDGTAISAIYEREQNNLVGWHRQPFPQGSLQSIALTKLGASTELWIAVTRTVGGTDAVYIERTAAEGEIEELSVFSDSSILGVVAGTAEAPIVKELDHLEGLEVQLLVGGAVHPSRTVVAGEVQLQPNFAKLGDLAIAGLAYTGKMKTLPLEGLNRAGTSQATKMRRNRVFVRLLESAIPEVNGVISPARFPLTPMDEGEGSFTGDIQVGLLGWDRFAEVEIEMPLPKPYNVLAIFGDAESNTL